MAYCKVLQWRFQSLYKEILTNLKNVRQTKVLKRFVYREEKENMEQRETNSNTVTEITEGLAASDKVKAVGCLCREAPSQMFEGILNATLFEKVSTTVVTQENLTYPKTQSNKMKFWTDPTFLLLWRRTHPVGR